MPHTLNPLALPEIELSDPQHDYVDKDRALEGFSSGEQNIGIYRFACSLRANGYTYKTAEALVRVCASNCQPPYPEDDVFEGPGWRSILDRTWRDHPDGGLVAKEEIEQAYTYLSEDSPFSDVFELHTIPRPKPMKYMVEGLVPEGWVTSIFAQGGLYKSWIALYVAICIKARLPMLGKQVAEPCNVLYIDDELTREVMAERAQLICNGLGIERPEGIHYWHLDGGILPKYDYIKSIIDYYDIKLVILDSLTIALQGIDVMNHEAIIAAMQRLQSLGTMIVIDHTSKMPMIPGVSQSQQTQFGSVFKRNLVRSSLRLIKGRNETMVMEHDKLTFAKTQPNIEFQMIEGDDNIKFVLIELSEELQRIVKALNDYGPLSAADLPQYTGLLPEEIGKYLEDGKKRGLLRPTDDGLWEAFKKKQRSALKDAIIDFVRQMNRPIKQQEFMDAHPEFDKNTIYGAFWNLASPKNSDERVLYKIGDQRNSVFWFDPELPKDKETAKAMNNTNLEDYHW